MKDVSEMIRLLKKEYPDSKYYLDFSNSLELLVAAILSAQCSDEVVNATTKKLFQKYKKAEDYANTRLSQLENDIKSITFYKNKAVNIKGACSIIAQQYGGKVPDEMEKLVKLPGVGRKTANAILVNAFNKIEGIPVDTHVIRLSYRLGLTKYKDPELIERDLKNIIPKEEWKIIPH